MFHPRKSHHATRLYGSTTSSRAPRGRKPLTPGSIVLRSRCAWRCGARSPALLTLPPRPSCCSERQLCSLSSLHCRAHMCVPGRPPRNGTSAEPLPVNRPAWTHSLAPYGGTMPRGVALSSASYHATPAMQCASPHPLLADCKRRAPLRDARRGGHQGTNLAPPGGHQQSRRVSHLSHAIRMIRRRVLS